VKLRWPLPHLLNDDSMKLGFTSLVCAISLSAALAQAAATNMALIPAGVYRPLFTSPADSNAVSVPKFYLDILPVTNADFLQFVTANPKWQRSKVRRIFADPDYLKNWASDTDLGPNAATNVPVTRVSWFAAKAYAQWKGKRLPTTAEWEYVAAASPTRADGENDPQFMRSVRHWYSTPSPETLAAVGLGQTNCFGVKDMHGLIWEWVADFNTAMVTGDARGDTGLDRQLFCGSGSVNSKDPDDFPAFMRYGFRSSLKASYTVHNLGFRCALDAEAQQSRNPQ
jgi:formylglycine-generating enzyme required for sulfatase activity